MVRMMRFAAGLTSPRTQNMWSMSSESEEIGEKKIENGPRCPESHPYFF